MVALSAVPDALVTKTEVAMILTIITAVACFVAAILMFTPYYRKMALLRPLAIYLVFEGVMVMFIYFMSELHPTNTIADVMNRIGTLAIVLYYIFILIMTKIKSRNKNKDFGDL